MAQLGVAGAGAVVGGVIGSFVGAPMVGAQIGWALGGVAGALLFPPKGPNQEGPRLGDLSVQTSGYGVPIPVVAARAKLAGNVIWKTDLEERKTTRRQGKGGGGPKITEYSYYLSWAVGLCEWLIPANSPDVLRIWLDNKLVYDTSGDSEVVAIPGLVWRFYPGSETQLPDPLIEATVGATEAPAHRGMAYIVFEDVPLDKFGNRMPQVTVELAAEVTRSFPEVAATEPASPIYASQPGSRLYNGFIASNVAVDYARGRIYEGRQRTGTIGTTPADDLIRVYDLVSMATIAEHRYDRVIAPLIPLGSSGTLNGNGVGLLHMGVDGFLYCAGGTSTHVPVVKIDPDTMQAVDFFGASLAGAGASFASPGSAYLSSPVNLVSFQVARLASTPRTFLAGVGNHSGCFIIDADTMVYVWGADTSVDPEPVVGVGALSNDHSVKLVPGLAGLTGTDVWWISGAVYGTATDLFIRRFRVASGAADLGSGVAMGITRTDFATIDVSAIDAGAARGYVVSAFYDQTDDSLVITFAGQGGTGSFSRLTTFKWTEAGGVVWSLVNHAGGSYDDARGDAGRYLSALWGRGGNLVVQPGTGDSIVNAGGDTWRQTLSWLSEQQAVIGWNSIAGRPLVKRYLTRVAADALTVGDVVSALCERAGLGVADINVAALTDSLRGYTLARPMSARDAITPLAAAFQFDAAEVDDVLLFRKRAGSVVATIPFADLVREDPDSSVIEEQRAQDAELPREVTVRFADIERGWEQNAQSWRRPISPTATMAGLGSAAIDLPMPLTVTEGKTVARRMCIATWRERTRITFPLGPEYLRLVPTDPVNVTTRDGASIRCRVLSTQLGANWVTRVEAVAEDAAVYGLTATGDGGSGWDEPAMPLPYYTRLIVPDLALIDDNDDLNQGGLREYAFACAYDGQRFRGVRVVRSSDNTAWSDIGLADTPVIWGSLVEAPTDPATPWTWDEVNSLAVRLTDGDVDSATSLEVLNGANIAALVGGDGSAEIVQWRTATVQADDTYLLTGLLRGRRGTEDQIAARAAGDAFILLDAARLSFSAGTGEVGATRYHRAVGIFDTIQTARPTVTKAARGRAEKPYAVAQVASSRDGGDNITITWVRRTRVGGEWLDGLGTVPVGEASETYEVDVMDGLPARYAPVYEASSVYDSITNDFIAEKAFDGSGATQWQTYFTTAGYLRVLYESALPVRRYSLQASASGVFAAGMPTDWTLLGRLPDGSWQTLDARSGQTGWSASEVRSFDIEATASFDGYELNITAVDGGTLIAIAEFRLYLAQGPYEPNVARLGTSVLRTITASSATAAYSAASQTTDFGGPVNAVFVNIYQMSGIVGRGIASEAIA